MDDLTQDYLKSILRYDPDTGEFTWLIDTWAELQPIGSSGYRGVTIKAHLTNPFIAQISVQKKKLHLGCFSTGEEAHQAYLAASQRLLPPLRGTIAGSIASNGRWRIKIGYREHMGHRLAWLYMTGEWPERDIDHEDRNPLNNRWDNLRLATPSQNAGNRGRGKNNTSGMKGVTFHDDCPFRPYAAMITVNGRAIYLGAFVTAEEAQTAYLAAAKKHFGEFARAE